MRALDAGRGRWDLVGSLVGVPIRITPWFWFSAALLGIRYYADPVHGSLGFFAFWMVAALVSVLLHELGHVLVGRLFGMKGSVQLTSLGGSTIGIDDLPQRWQRLLVYLSGPLASLAVLGLILATTLLPFPELFWKWGWQEAVFNALWIVVRINLTWAILNLVPLWPLDGGHIACQIGEGLFGRRGLTAARVLSLLTAMALVIVLTLELSLRLDLRFDPRYLLYLEEFAVFLLFGFLLWLRSVKALF